MSSYRRTVGLKTAGVDALELPRNGRPRKTEFAKGFGQAPSRGTLSWHFATESEYGKGEWHWRSFLSGAGPVSLGQWYRGSKGWMVNFRGRNLDAVVARVAGSWHLS